MTALFSTRKRAEEFAAAVDAPSRALDDSLRPLMGVVTSLRETAAADPLASPRDDFAADLRGRLMAEAAEVLTPGSPLVLPARPRGRRERKLVAAASAVVVLGGSAGMAAAAQGALPGDALYPVKRGIERVEAGLSVSNAGKGRDLLHQASDRLSEVEGLLARDSVAASPRIPSALVDFTTQAEAGAALLMDSFEETRDAAEIESVRRFAADGIETLHDISRTAPPTAQDELTAAALALRDIDVRASELCTSCTLDMPTVEVPGALLVAAEVDRAMTAADPGALDNSHPFVVPKSLLAKGQTLTGRRAPRTGGGSDDAGVGTAVPSAPRPPDTADQDVPNEADVAKPERKRVDETVDQVEDGVQQVEEGVEASVGQITDGLSGVVETVLPDPVPSPLLP